MRARGDVMSVPVDFESQEFAVISVHGEPGLERMVLGYSDEQSLRDCLAEASILALGYSSREEALENIDSIGTASRVVAQTERAALPGRLAQWRLGEQWLCAGTFDLRRSRSMFVQILQHGVVFAIVLIYSKNLFSTMVRALVSF